MRNLIAAEGSYRQRCAALQRNKIAVWDVLARSARPGSLDADIDMATAEVNDFEWFFAGHSAVGRICFNGQAAAKIFRQRIPDKVLPADIELLTLPSTSPAYAAMRFEQKLELWRSGIGMQSG
jgi:hypoxanthine-DNA glycosylase